MNDPVTLDDAERYDVHQTIVAKRWMEIYVASEVGHAHGIAVGSDAINSAGSHIRSVRSGNGCPKTQRVRAGDDFGAHAEHVA